MQVAPVNGVTLCYEETGAGEPLVWAHEYGGDLRSWEPQVRHFCRRYRVITYNHRGYSPSTIPRSASGYSEDLLVEDLHQLLSGARLVAWSEQGGYLRVFEEAIEPWRARDLVSRFLTATNRAFLKPKRPLSRRKSPAVSPQQEVSV